jgi:hypothetical protein
MSDDEHSDHDLSDDGLQEKAKQLGRATEARGEDPTLQFDSKKRGFLGSFNLKRFGSKNRESELESAAKEKQGRRRRKGAKGRSSAIDEKELRVRS